MGPWARRHDFGEESWVVERRPCLRYAQDPAEHGRQLLNGIVPSQRFEYGLVRVYADRRSGSLNLGNDPVGGGDHHHAQSDEEQPRPTCRFHQIAQSPHELGRAAD